MNPADPFAVVKECKGAALSILVLLATNQQLGGGAVTQEWLERHSGYTDKPVSQALAYLSETGRINRTSAGWVLAGAYSPPGSLPAAPPISGSLDREEQSRAAPSGEEVQGQPPLSPVPLPLEGEADRELSDSLTAASANDPEINPIQAEAEEKGVGIIPTRLNLEHVEANLAAFKKWGVGRNEKTIMLSSRPEVTPQQIDAIAKRLIGERRFTTGLLITAVQCDDQPVPNLPSKYSPHQEERDPGKYVDWEQ
jgi:hypothetical protein